MIYFNSIMIELLAETAKSAPTLVSSLKELVITQEMAILALILLAISLMTILLSLPVAS
jgi:hypothetical protein